MVLREGDDEFDSYQRAVSASEHPESATDCRTGRLGKNGHGGCLFEYDPSRMQLPDFYRGDLVVTTLAYARGDALLVAHSLQALMNQGIAGLLVKTAYFSELPQPVIALANRLGTPCSS